MPKNNSPLLFPKSAFLNLSADNNYTSFLGADAIVVQDGCWTIGPNNSIYIAGSVDGNFPVTTGAYDETYDGSRDGVVAKINATGDGYEWATYLGGSSTETINDIVVDDLGNVYVTGASTGNFPQGTNDLKFKIGFQSNAFLTKISPDGSSVEHSILFGGTGFSEGRQILLDNQSNVYVLADTSSADHNTTAEAYNQTSNGGYDVILMKISSNFDELIFSSYLGGGGEDRAKRMALDEMGNIYITGKTEKWPIAPFPTTEYDYLDGEPSWRNFFCIFDPNFTTLEYSILLFGTDPYGDEDSTVAFDLDDDDENLVHFAFSSTYSQVDAYNPAINNTYSANYGIVFLTLELNTSSLKSLGLIHGDGHSYLRDMYIGESGLTYAAIDTMATDFPITSRNNEIGYEAGSKSSVILIVPQTFDEIYYSTYVPGNDSEQSYNILVYPNETVVGTLYRTDSTNINTSESAIADNLASNYDYCMYAINPNLLPSQVENLTMTGWFNETKELEISWNEAENAQWYNVYVNSTIYKNILGTSFNLTVTESGTYLFRVEAENDFGKGPESKTLVVVVDLLNDSNDDSSGDSTDDSSGDSTDDSSGGSTDDSSGDSTDDSSGDSTDDSSGDSTGDGGSPGTIPGYSFVIEIGAIALVLIFIREKKKFQFRNV